MKAEEALEEFGKGRICGFVHMHGFVSEQRSLSRQDNSWSSYSNLCFRLSAGSQVRSVQGFV